MTAPNSAAVASFLWEPMARRLAEQLAAHGDLHDPRWRDALLAVPRHEFIPRYYEQEPNSRPLRWTAHQPHDFDSTRRWLELVYSPTTLVTELADYADRGVRVPVSSSTKPDLMIRILETLRIADGMRVLEIGTGTGYNAALLTHRLGDHQVFSVDIDPQLVSTARRRLDHLGYTPTLAAVDGAEGLAEHSPYDRIVATCALSAVPPSWIEQLRPGGLALVDIEGPLGAGNLIALHRLPDRPALQGRFLPWWGTFMRRRATAGPSVGEPRPTRTSERPTTRTTNVDPAELDGGKMFPFLAQLYLPTGMYRSITLYKADTPVTELRAPDGSWCQITRSRNAAGLHTLQEAGPTPIAEQIEHAWQRWRDLGTPAWDEFGLTATPTEQYVWYQDPRDGPRWHRPAPTIQTGPLRSGTTSPVPRPREQDRRSGVQGADHRTAEPG